MLFIAVETGDSGDAAIDYAVDPEVYPAKVNPAPIIA